MIFGTGRPFFLQPERGTPPPNFYQRNLTTAFKRFDDALPWL
jgi:hypothetical protein